MCGIIAYLGTRSAGPILYEGLQNLEYRGYDSVGIALGNGRLTLNKQAGEVGGLTPPDVPDATYGIGHTRWSTHGPPTDENAHPHTDCTGRIAVVHNGIIDNHEALREELSDHTFTSETDTEVIPHLLEEQRADGGSLLEAVERVNTQLTGSFAFCAMDAEEGVIVGTRHQSPLVLGYDEGGGFLASDVPAFLKHTREVSFLEDGDTVVLDTDGVRIRQEGKERTVDVETIAWDPEAAEKGGYDHYMRKEIHEQPTALRRAISDRLDRRNGHVNLDIAFPSGYLDSLDEIQLIAAGTSYYAAQFGAMLLEQHLDVRATASVASEYAVRSGSDPCRTLTIAVTQSGETKDTLDALRAANAAGARSLAVTNIRGSSVTREADDTVLIRAGPEIAVASTKAFSSQVVILYMLAVALGRARGEMTAGTAREILESLADLPGAIQQLLDREGRITELVAEFIDAESYFFVGRRFGYPVALEGALKLKEISYAHAEGFPAGELKHGPLALVTAQTPVLAVMTTGTHPAETMHNVREAQAREAPIIGIVTEGEQATDVDARFEVPNIGSAEALVANVIFQLIAYHTAKELGRPIDKPRNLAKSVTVD